MQSPQLEQGGLPAARGGEAKRASTSCAFRSESQRRDDGLSPCLAWCTKLHQGGQHAHWGETAIVLPPHRAWRDVFYGPQNGWTRSGSSLRATGGFSGLRADRRTRGERKLIPIINMSFKKSYTSSDTSLGMSRGIAVNLASTQGVGRGGGARASPPAPC